MQVNRHSLGRELKQATLEGACKDGPEYDAGVMRELCGMQGLQALQPSLHPSVQPPATTHPTRMCVVHYAGSYAGSIEQHELVFCAQAS